mgnify:CR=1 FL=1
MSPETTIYELLISDQQSAGVNFGRGEHSVNIENEVWQTLLGYRRFKDFDSSNGSGQDFAIIGHDQLFAIGVIADGVSQSFFGDIAAKVISTNLYNFLWENRCLFPEKQRVEDFLNSLCQKVNEEISTINLNEYGFILQKALSETKRKGSQTVFASFILNLKTKKSIFYNVGDLEVIVYQKDGSDFYFQKVSAANANGRWSSAGKSDLLMDVEELSNVVGIVAYSDGLVSKNLSGWGEDFNYSKLKEFRKVAEKEASRDDVSFISVLTLDLLDFNSLQKLDLSDIPVFSNINFVEPNKTEQNQNDELNKTENNSLLKIPQDSVQEVRAKPLIERDWRNIFIDVKNKISNNKAYFLMGLFTTILLIGFIVNFTNFLENIGLAEPQSGSTSNKSIIHNKNDFDDKQIGIEKNSIPETAISNGGNNLNSSGNSISRNEFNRSRQKESNYGLQSAEAKVSQGSITKPTETPTRKPTRNPTNKNIAVANETKPTETPKTVETPVTNENSNKNIN